MIRVIQALKKDYPLIVIIADIATRERCPTLWFLLFMYKALRLKGFILKLTLKSKAANSVFHYLFVIVIYYIQNSLAYEFRGYWSPIFFSANE